MSDIKIRMHEFESRMTEQSLSQIPERNGFESSPSPTLRSLSSLCYSCHLDRIFSSFDFNSSFRVYLGSYIYFIGRLQIKAVIDG
jgi:hypothetical protein